MILSVLLGILRTFFYYNRATNILADRIIRTIQMAHYNGLQCLSLPNIVAFLFL